MNLRIVLGALIGLGGLGAAGAFLLSQHTASSKASGTSNATPSGQIEGHGTGETVSVGVASGWATPVYTDTGAVDNSYNPPGWDYVQIGGKI